MSIYFREEKSFAAQNKDWRTRIAALSLDDAREMLTAAELSYDHFLRVEQPSMVERFNALVVDMRAHCEKARDAKTKLLAAEQIFAKAAPKQGDFLREDWHKNLTDAANASAARRAFRQNARLAAKEAQVLNRFMREAGYRNENFIKNLEDHIAKLQAPKL